MNERIDARPGAPSTMLIGLLVSLVLAVCTLVPVPALSQTAARDLFGAAAAPAPLAARSLGSYARGCLAGGVPLAIDGPAWQVMRLSRNRNWGHPELVALLERLAVDARADGWPGLLVGDLAQPRGGPMTSGHTSHQIGLDADIWLTPMPNRTLSRTEREEMSAKSMLKGDTLYVDPAVFTPAHAGVIRRAAKYPQTARIFVHPGIKKALCESAGSDRDWLRKVRPWWGHHYHFHVRIACPRGSAGCSNQDPPPAGDGCGSELDWWLSPEPWKPSPTPAEPAKPLSMADLPAECRVVLDAGSAAPAPNAPAGNPPTSGAPAAVTVPMPRPRP